MKPSIPKLLLALIVLGSLALPLHAADEGAGEATPDASKKEAKKDGPPSIASVVEDMKTIEGFLPLYRDKDKLLLAIPKKKLGEPMLLATSIAGGSYLTGFQWVDMMVRFEQRGDQLALIRPDTRFGTREKGPISGAVERTHPGFLVAALPILAEDSDKLLVSLSDLYSKQASAFIGSLAAKRNPSLARLAKVKNFPDNTEVAVELPGQPSGLDHGDILTVHYSLSNLPQNDYKPRIADNRVGYFLTVAKDYSSDYRDDTTFVRYANRWKLEKADPSLDLSPPKEPIIFYIEKTVPTRYRRWVREGIVEWNKAFEEIGFVNAIEVRQQTDTQFADLDPEDVRYNFFRWITSDRAFAMGPSRVDPRTGQILDADILFDDAMVRAYVDDWDLLVEEAMLETRSPADQKFFEAHPDWDPLRHIRTERQEDPARRDLLNVLASINASEFGKGIREPVGSGRSLCGIGRGRARQMALASLYLSVLAADGEGEEGEEGKDEPEERQWPEEFIGQIIKETVMHEVGHTLGLRHNFKASSWRPFEDLHADGDGEAVKDLASSVMDYNPINLAPEGRKQGLYQMTTIGPYDYWAIEFGYSPTNDEKELEAIASKGAQDGHDYATDEDIWLGDPLTNRWDFGQDPLDYAKSQVELTERIKADVVDRVVREGESYDSARSAINQLFSSVGYAGWLASRHVGGTYFHRDHRGDPDARDPIVVVPAAKQREALDFVTTRVFAPTAFELPDDVMRKLAPSRWSHWGTWGVWGAEAAYPYHDRVLSMQAWSLSQLMSPSTLDRILNTEMAARDKKDILTLPELFQGLTGSVFAELQKASGGSYTNAEPMLTGVRRNLQREYVARLIDLTLSGESSWYPRAARNLAWYELQRLGETLDGFLANGSRGGLDDYTRAHLEETHQRIERALEASFELKS